MPEWSKGVDLRSTVFVRVGSNPTSSNCPIGAMDSALDF